MFIDGFNRVEAQIEYLVVTFDDEHKKVRLSLRQADILDALANDENLRKQGGCVPDLQTVDRQVSSTRNDGEGD